MGEIRRKLAASGRKWAEAFPTIFVSLFLFLTIYNFFGVSQVILVLFLTLTFRTKSKQGFSMRELLRCYGIQLVVFAAAYTATLNLVLCILLNFLVPFIIVFLLTDKFNPKAYFIYGMEFVFMELVPIKAAQIPTRLFTLLYSYCFLTAALFFYAQIIKKRRNYGTVKKGMNNMALQLRKLAAGKSVSGEMEALVEMMYHMNRVIYTSRNYNYITIGYGVVNYYFMLLFQRFRYFVNELAAGEKLDSPQNAAYLIKLSSIFIDIEKNINQEDNSSLIKEVQIFIAQESLDTEVLKEGMRELLVLLCYSMRRMTEVGKNKVEKEWKLPKNSHKVKGIRSQFHLNQFHMRFALRLAIVLCISVTFCRAVDFEHSYWYPMSAFLMLMPYSEESTMKINNRMLGTIAGLTVTFFLTEIFTTINSHIVIIVVMTCLMYYAPVTSWTMTMYSTCYGLALTTLSLPRSVAIELRFIYVFAAAVTVFLANRFILPNTAKAEFIKSVNALLDIDKAMVREVRKSVGVEVDLNLMRDLNLQQNLASQEIEDYISKNMNKEEQEFYRQLVPINRQLVTEIEQISSYIRSHKVSVKDSMILQEILKNIEHALERIRRSYTSKELTGSIMTGVEKKTFGILDEELYFNTLALNCMGTVSDMLNLFEGKKSEE